MIAYYVHHHGRGHLSRAQCIARHTRAPVAGLSSLPRPADWDGPWIELPMDTGDFPAGARDPEAHGRLHWAPLGHAGLRHRMGLTAAWITRHAPKAFVSDVSVEMLCLARLMGIPSIAVAMRGTRTDPAHQLGYDLADLLLAPWAEEFAEPGIPHHLAAKTVHTGAFSRCDDRPILRHPHSAAAAGDDPRPLVLVMLGAGGAAITAAQLKDAADGNPGWRWRTLGGPGGSWADDPWPLVCAADVVVTHAGQNAVAECAAARRPTVVLPQDRPFGEQHAVADALEQGRLAVVHRSWPRRDQWPAVLDSARRMGGEAWSRWSPGDGAARAARVLDEFPAHLSGHPEVSCVSR
ncbi:glycosyltransferase [Streptodolium elevatio]